MGRLAGKVAVPAGTSVVSLVSGGNIDPERAFGVFSTSSEGRA